MKERDRTLTFLSYCPEETVILGESIASGLKGGDIIALSGELGAGKTVLIKGICKTLKVKENVSSSSFVLFRSLSGIYPVYHFDLYRLNTDEELQDLACEEYLFSEGISLIEWAEKLEEHLGGDYLAIILEYLPEEKDSRKITLLPEGERFRKLLEEITIPLERIH